MIHSVPIGGSFTYRGRGRVGQTDAAAAGATAGFSLASAGISAGVGVAMAGLQMWIGSIQQSHNAMTATTLIVNGLEQQLKNLLAAYLAEPAPTCADQRAALNAYDQSIAWLQSPAACGNPNFGSAGNACIRDRIGNTAIWPWKSYYRDPIANDPRMNGRGCDTGQDVLLPSLTTGGYTDAGITSTGGSSSSGLAVTQPAAAPAGISQTVSSSSTPYLLIGAALVGALILAESL